MKMPSRQEANDLLNEWVQSTSLKNHCYAVEAAMRAYAKYFDEDEQMYAIAGLLHDFDFEKHPNLEQHPKDGVQVLKELGYDDAILDAIMGHGNHTGVARTSNMAKALFAVDELSGLIVALAHVRPGNFDGMTAKSVKKAMKKKAFAQNVSREDIQQGIEELGVDATQHYERVIAALAPHADKLCSKA